MKIEIEKSEYDRLKSREEKLMAYYYWFVDRGHNLVSVEDIITENINLKEENEKLKESLDIATKCSSKEEDGIIRLSEENKKLKEKLKRKEGIIANLRDDKRELEAQVKRLKELYKYNVD